MTPCPNCGNFAIWYADTALKHIMRGMIGSRKRYCLTCGRKWRARSFSKRRVFTFSFIYLAFFLLVGNFAVRSISDIFDSHVPSSGMEGADFSVKSAGVMKSGQSQSKGFGLANLVTSSNRQSPGYRQQNAVNSNAPADLIQAMSGAMGGGEKYSLRDLKEKYKRDPRVIAALKSNPGLIDDFKKKYKDQLRD